MCRFPSDIECEDYKAQFKKIDSRFEDCLFALDGSHCPIVNLPIEREESYVNRHGGGQHSVLLLGVVSPDLKFIFVRHDILLGNPFMLLNFT
jgi:hypothetical protein